MKITFKEFESIIKNNNYFFWHGVHKWSIEDILKAISEKATPELLKQIKPVKCIKINRRMLTSENKEAGRNSYCQLIGAKFYKFNNIIILDFEKANDKLAMQIL